MTWIACILGAYLTGSIPFGVLIGRWRGVDIRQLGSGNIGANNVARVLGPRFGLLCFILDFAKGAVPVLAAGFITGLIHLRLERMPPVQLWLWLAVAAAAVIGHMCSPFLKFGGGKGVATAFGALASMWPVLTLPALGALAVWYAVLRLKRYVSLASILAAASMPFWYLLQIIPANAENQPLTDTLATMWRLSPPLIVTTVLALLVVFKHRANIGRIRRGEEPRVGGQARHGAIT